MKYQLKCKINNNDIVDLIIKADNETEAKEKIFKQYKNVVEILDVSDQPKTISSTLANYKVKSDKREIHTSLERNAYPYIIKNQRGNKQNVVAVYT